MSLMYSLLIILMAYEPVEMLLCQNLQGRSLVRSLRMREDPRGVHHLLEIEEFLAKLEKECSQQKEIKNGLTIRCSRWRALKSASMLWPIRMSSEASLSRRFRWTSSNLVVTPCNIFSVTPL